RWRYTYDPLGRRITKQRQHPDGDTPAERIDFIWDGTQLAEQVTGASTTTWEYTPGTFTPVGQIDQDEVDRRFYAIITDLTGTPTELVTPDGNVAWQQRTNLWGHVIQTRTDGPHCPLRFPGQYHAPETGDHYNYHRYYDPTTGRYHSGDPLGLAPAPNPYAYVHNPTAAFDPLGLSP